MIKMCSFFFCGLALALVSGCATLERSSGNAEWADVVITNDVELVVHGLSCPLCASNLDQHLLRMEGVSDMWIDLQTGYVQIEVKPGHEIPANAFERAVRNAGFTLRDIRPRGES